MAVLAGKTTELYKNTIFVTCKCGCDDGVIIRIDDENKEYDHYAIMTYINANWYRDQRGAFGVLKWKLKKIWKIITNKDYYYSDIVMTKEDFQNFKEYVNQFGEN